MPWKKGIGSFHSLPRFGCIYMHSQSLSDSCFRYMLQVYVVCESLRQQHHTFESQTCSIVISWATPHALVSQSTSNIGTSWLLSGRATLLVAPEAPAKASEAEQSRSLTTEAAGSSLAWGHDRRPKSKNLKCQDTIILALRFEVNWQLWNDFIPAFFRFSPWKASELQETWKS